MVSLGQIVLVVGVGAGLGLGSAALRCANDACVDAFSGVVLHTHSHTQWHAQKTCNKIFKNRGIQFLHSCGFFVRLHLAYFLTFLLAPQQRCRWRWRRRRRRHRCCCCWCWCWCWRWPVATHMCLRCVLHWHSMSFNAVGRPLPLPPPLPWPLPPRPAHCCILSRLYTSFAAGRRVCFLFLRVRVLFFVLFGLFAASFLVVFWAIRACVARPHCVRDLRQSEPAAVHHLDSFFSIRLLCFICRFILFPSGLLLRRCCCRCLCLCCWLFVYLFFLALFIIWLATFW